MINNNTTYKSTSIGLIPSDWEVMKLKEIILEAKLGGNYENSESNEGIPVIKMGNIGRGNMNISKIQNLPLNEKYNLDDVLKKGDLLFNTRNTLDLVGKVAIWNNEIPFALYNSNLLRLAFKSQFVASNWFMNYSLNSVRSLVQLRGFATGTTSVAAIYGRDLNHLKLPLPPLQEQQKIATILSTWDKAIDNCKAIIEELKVRNKGLTQKLLTGKMRVKGFEKANWSLLPIKKFAKDSSKKNPADKDLIVLSCTKHNGLVPSLEYFGRKIYSDDLTTYKIVSKGQFAYATNHIEEGSIGYQFNYDEALISPMYTVFQTDESVNDNFLFRVLKSNNYIHEYQKRMEGSIDRRGGLRWDEFSKIKVPVPVLKEQFAIVEILDKATEEFNQYQQKLQTLQLQKKGLMQQLLTGKTRVKI
jgi:type I restriction enzyme S subunit